MPTTLIFGGSGKVARHLTSQLVAEGHQVHSVIRNAAQTSELEQLGATPIVQSIEDASVSELTQTIKSVGPDYVVWAAGAGAGNSHRTLAVDRDGAIKVMDATASAGVKRYITVSALDVRDTTLDVPSWYDEKSRGMSQRVWGAIGPYMAAKLAADRNLRTGNETRKLDYSIVRPGGLSMEAGVGRVSAGKVGLGSMVSREDVASVVVECIRNDGTIGLAFDVVGGDVPISAAVDNVVVNHADTFEGYY